MSNFGYDVNAAAGINGLSAISRDPRHHHHHHHHGKAGVSAMGPVNYPVNPAVNPAINMPVGPPPMVSPAQFGPGPGFCPPQVVSISHVHLPCVPVCRPRHFSSVGVILVLFILLVIISRVHHTI